MAKKKGAKASKKARSAAMKKLPTLSAKMKQFPDLCAEMDLSSSGEDESIHSQNKTGAMPPLSPIKKGQSSKRQARSSPLRQPADEEDQSPLPAAETNTSPSAHSLMELIQGKDHKGEKEIL
jgi:hypothetical protein